MAIDRKLLKKRGAVSGEAASALARNIWKQMKTDYGIGITGIAGPGGGSRAKPAGLVYIALSVSRKTRVWEHQFRGDRHQIRQKTVVKALEYLWRELR